MSKKQFHAEISERRHLKLREYAKFHEISMTDAFERWIDTLKIDPPVQSNINQSLRNSSGYRFTEK